MTMRYHEIAIHLSGFSSGSSGSRRFQLSVTRRAQVPAETRDLVRWCQDKGIVVTAYGSLGRSGEGIKLGGNPMREEGNMGNP